MERSHSMSSILSISSESLNIYSGDSLILTKEKSLRLCMNEFNSINQTLECKLQNLKEWEKDLQCKEKKIVNLCNSVNKYVQSEVSIKSMKIIDDIQERYSKIESKYNSLKRDHKRLQRSFETIKNQNKAFKLKEKEHILVEEMLRKERDKLASKVTLLSSNSCQQVHMEHKSVSVQTAFSTRNQALSSLSNHDDTEKRLDSSLSFSSILRELWLQMFHMSLHNLFILDIHEPIRPHQTFPDICLLIIPMCIEYLRSAIQANIGASMSPTLRKRHVEVIAYHIEMLYWSLVYMDIGRIPLRPGIMSPLTRLGEDIALIVLSKTSSPIQKYITNDDNIHSLMVLLSLRCVNQVDILSRLLQSVCDLMNNGSNMVTILLAKYMLVPLLCRWTSAATCYSSLYPKILTIVLQSIDKKIDYDSERCSIAVIGSDQNKVVNTGLDQLIFLITKLSLNMTETNNANSSHPLVFLLDILHTSKPNENEKIVAVLSRIMHLKQIKVMSRGLGIVSIISNLISQNTEPTLLCVTKLRSILDEVTN